MTTRHPMIALGMAFVLGCGGPDARTGAPPASRTIADRATLTVRDSTITATYEAAGVAAPIRRATLSTKLMGNVVEVLVREGERVIRGQPLARTDIRDVEAKRSQADAGVAVAQAAYGDAETQAGRYHALYADSAATRYQVDQVETSLARARAALETARASRREIDALRGYGTLRAPFAGVVTRRYVDPGAFVAPGAPVVEVQDASRLRVSVSVPPRVAAGLRRGQELPVEIEGRSATGTVEGMVPAAAGAVYTVNALVDNPGHEFLPGSAATLRIPDGSRRAVLIPRDAMVVEGDLTGVRVPMGATAELRWIKTAPAGDGAVEVLAGLRAGDTIMLGGD